MFRCRHWTFSRRVAFVYVIAICFLFVLHFKIADDFTFKYVRYHSAVQNRFRGFTKTESDQYLMSNPEINAHSFSNPRHVMRGQNSHLVTEKESNSLNQMLMIEAWNRNSRPITAVETLIRKTKDRMTGHITTWRRKSHDTTRSNPLFTPPVDEVPERRYPQCVIIGFTKCGTRALIEFMSLHPFIRVARNEVHFYDKDENFQHGFDWYKRQMPLSYSNQITVEKTPAYVLSRRARDGVHQVSPSAKLIMLVRDPVVRLVSQFVLRFRVINSGDNSPVTAIYRNNKTGQFDPESRPVEIGKYHKHIKMWLERFHLHQMLILNSEDLTRNPLPVIKKVEKFLEIPSLFSKDNVYLNTTSGFYCPRGFEPSSWPRCLGKTKGLSHPKLPPDDEIMLYRYYRPYNEKLFQLLGYRINWTEKEWGNGT